MEASLSNIYVDFAASDHAGGMVGVLAEVNATAFNRSTRISGECVAVPFDKEFAAERNQTRIDGDYSP